ncbi:hypothetical protein [Spiroplasma endosymbiont of Polydrusus pterygomalis]|uniref:hypothetical protein n=1 Tax=Spiroplasma endosymbiont of Polydrusus pterygomalis TaxID=3139327 RepID=UPI003CCB1B91
MEKSGRELTAEEIELHNKNAEIRNKASKKYEKERRSKTAKALGFKSTETALKNKLSQLELDKSEINSASSSKNTSTSESVTSNNINKI